MEYEDLISIATPEGVALTLTLAGLGSRGVATLLDWCVRLPILIVAAIPAAHSDAGRIVFILVAFVMVYVYDVLFEAFGGGRTPGKRWTSLRVLHADGRPESAGAAAVRNVVRIVDWLPSFYLVGGASIVATARNQRLGDLAADTIVVREPRPPKLEPHNARRRRLRRRTTAVQPAPTHRTAGRSGSAAARARTWSFFPMPPPLRALTSSSRPKWAGPTITTGARWVRNRWPCCKTRISAGCCPKTS